MCRLAFWPLVLAALCLFSFQAGGALAEEQNRIEGKYGFPTAPGAYRIAYVRSEANRTTYWVAQHLTADKIGAHVSREGFSFHSDNDVAKEFRVTPADYKGSAFNEGHLCPAADAGPGKQAMWETFYFTNAVPQDAKLNQDQKLGWAALEDDLRAVVAKGNAEAWLFTGPAFLPGDDGILHVTTIGPHAVPVPTHCWKAALFVANSTLTVSAWLVPNEPPTKHYSEYAVSVDTLERAVGLDFWSALDDDIEAKLERKQP